MDKYKYDESNGLWYELKGDYYFPCLTLPEQQDVEIGVWGERRRRFLRQHHRVLYYNLMTAGTLFSHLAEINQQAEEMFFRVVNELSEKEDITEKLKAENQMLWVQRINNIRNRAMEIVNANLIYT